MKISIIVSAYKAERSIVRCLSSLVAQSYSDIEIILVNDGSPDNTFTKCFEWAEKDKRVTVIDQSNSGVSAARNKGIQYANGDYITFVDADDWVASDMYEKLSSASKNGEADMTVCSIYHISGKTLQKATMYSAINICQTGVK